MICRFVVLTAATLGLAAAADVKIVEEIVAKVNGDIVTKGDLEEKQREVELMLRQQQHLNGQQLTQAVNDASKDILREKIDELLLVQKAKDSQVNVDGDVAKYLADLQVQSKLSDPDKFHEWIQQETGMPFEEYKQKITNDYLVHRVVSQEVGSRVVIPEAQLQKYYDDHKADFVRKEQVFLSQILISTEGKTPQQVATAEAKAKDVVARARKGEKFSELVSAYSDDPETSRQGGQLGAYQRGLMPKDMEDVVFKGKRGDVTDPFKRPQGFVILRIDDRWEAGQASFDEVRDQIQDVMARPQMEARMRPFLERLRTEAFLEIKDGYTDTGAAPGKDTRWHDVAVLKPQTTTKEEVAAEHKRHKHLLFVPIPGTVSARGGQKNVPIDTASLGERREIAPATQPVVATGAPADGSAPAPAAAPGTPGTAGTPAATTSGATTGLAPSSGSATTPAPVESSSTPAPAELSVGKRGKTKAAADKPDKPPTGSGSAAPIKQ
ncbi:MAG TPA: peptidylprolyl isomerase [Bryobacteraceae bacterium]|nr:peptidylprolyl isomerase [Bryobacteraceae bacterium]